MEYRTLICDLNDFEVAKRADELRQVGRGTYQVTKAGTARRAARS
jgi:hypothetical protein